MSGLLGGLFSVGNDMKKRVRGLLGDPIGFANAEVGAFNDRNLADARTLLDPRANAAAKRDAAVRGVGELGVGPGLLGSVKVYHGSPHVFNKADSSKIGTGEGAQAYGHGLYWAENKDVAKQYADVLGKEYIAVNGKPVDISSFPPLKKSAYQLASRQGVDKTVAEIQRQVQSGDMTEAGARGLLAELQALRGATVTRETQSNMYEANLRWPDAAREAKDPLGPQHFLDWNSPLRDQSPFVKKALHSAGVNPEPQALKWVQTKPNTWEAGDYVLYGDGGRFHWYSKTPDASGKYKTSADANDGGFSSFGSAAADLNNFAHDPKLSGGLLYRSLSGMDDEARGFMNGAQSSAAVAADLRKAGIPGITYLDAGSRSAGQGTRNYVTFDDALVELLTRNGLPIK